MSQKIMTEYQINIADAGSNQDARYNETISEIQNKFLSLNANDDDSKIKQNLTDLLLNLSRQLVAYRMMHYEFFTNNREIKGSECAKDKINFFLSSLAKIDAKIQELARFIANPHSAKWTNEEINFFKSEIGEIMKMLKPFENVQDDFSLCRYYNEIGVLD